MLAGDVAVVLEVMATKGEPMTGTEEPEFWLMR